MPSSLTSQSICAVVVTFNRNMLLKNCLQALLSQTMPVSAICILDNHSTDGTSSYLADKGFISSLPPENPEVPYFSTSSYARENGDGYTTIHYARMHENLGGAGGFSQGIQIAYESGYDYVWLMDDDGIPDSQALQKLIEKKLSSSVACSLVVEQENEERLCFGLRIRHKSLYRRDSLKDIASHGVLPSPSGNFFNSVLIPREIIQKVGFPYADFFIWGDEMEYMYRILSHHFRVYTVIDSIHRHPAVATQPAAWKQYYFVRNMLILIRQYNSPRYTIVPIKALAKVLLCTLGKGRNVRLICKGLWDGIMGNLGKM